MALETMSEDDIIRILATEEDLLTPKLAAGPKLCPGCGGALSVKVEAVGIRYNCLSCGLVLDPETGFISRLGNTALTEEPDLRMIIRPTRDAAK